MRKAIVIVALILVIAGGAYFAIYAYRERVREENQRQHAEAMYDLVQQLRDVPSGGIANLQRYMELDHAALKEWLEIDPSSPVSKTLNAYQLAVGEQSNDELEKKNADLEIDTARLQGRAPGVHLRTEQRVAAAKVEAIGPIVETCQRDVEHYLYGRASTGTCQSDMDEYDAAFQVEREKAPAQ